MSQQNSPRMVHCKKFDKELPGIPFKPFPNDFGKLLFDNVSMQAWQMWLKESPRYINTYRLDLQTKEGRDFLERQMLIFFGFETGDLADTAWRPPEA